MQQQQYANNMAENPQLVRCEGWLIMLDFESEEYLKQLKRIPNNTLSIHRSLKRYLSETNDPKILQDIQHLLDQIRAGHATFTPLAEATYQSFLAHYTSTPQSRKPNNIKDTVRIANDYALHSLGLNKVPCIEEDVLKKMLFYIRYNLI